MFIKMRFNYFRSIYLTETTLSVFNDLLFSKRKYMYTLIKNVYKIEKNQIPLHRKNK